MSQKSSQSSDLEAGYNVGNLSELDSRFKCTHCHLVLRDPVQGDCGHRYCRNCVQAMYTAADGRESLCEMCEASERSIIAPDHTYPDNAIKREINKKLQVLCPNSPCTSKMLVSELAAHFPECKFRPIPCDLCGHEVPSATMSQHKKTQCPKRLEHCKKCKAPVAMDTMDDHLSTVCPGSTKECEFCLARGKDDPESVDAHLRKECPSGWHQDLPCPYGCAEAMPKGPDGWRQHRLDCQAVHVDRLLALAKKAAAAHQESKPTPAPAEKKPTSRGLEDPSDGAPAAQAPVADGVAGVAPPIAQSSDLPELMDRVSRIERRLKQVALPAGALTGQDGDRKRADEYLRDLHAALGQEEELNRLIEEVRAQFETCYDKIRQYELRIQKDLEKKLDIERKHQELVKLLAYKEMKILDLERRVEILEHAGYDGVLLWKITDVRKRKEEAREGKVCSIYSPPFYTGKAGYKMCGRLYLNGDGAGKNTHISLFFVIMRGAFDALLPWPFAKKVSMLLLDQNFEEHVIDAFKPDTTSSSFKRPTTDMNIASGCPLFMPLSDFENSSRGYVKDDTMFIKFVVDKSDLPM